MESKKFLTKALHGSFQKHELETLGLLENDPTEQSADVTFNELKNKDETFKEFKSLSGYSVYYIPYHEKKLAKDIKPATETFSSTIPVHKMSNWFLGVTLSFSFIFSVLYLILIFSNSISLVTTFTELSLIISFGFFIMSVTYKFYGLKKWIE